MATTRGPFVTRDSRFVVRERNIARNSRRVGLEGKGEAGGGEAAEEEVHGPLPTLGLSLLAGLDAPEPSGGGLELRLAVAAPSAGGHGEGSGGGGLADAAGRTQGRGGVADDGHCSSRNRGNSAVREVVRCLNGWSGEA